MKEGRKKWEDLVEEYNDLFPRYSPLYARLKMPSFIECDLGWYDLIEGLCRDIREILKKHPEIKNFSVLQVKEKFGGLKFYVGGANEEIFNRIRKAEEDSYKICEICGAEGRLRRIGRIFKTVCNDCYRRLKDDHSRHSRT